MKRHQLYRVWALGSSLYLPKKIELFVSATVTGPLPANSLLSYDKTSCRVISAESPRKAVRKYVRSCLPMMIHLADDGPNEPHDITHLRPGPRAAEMRRNLRLAKRHTTDQFGRLQFKLIEEPSDAPVS